MAKDIVADHEIYRGLTLVQRQQVQLAIGCMALLRSELNVEQYQAIQSIFARCTIDNRAENMASSETPTT